MKIKKCLPKIIPPGWRYQITKLLENNNKNVINTGLNIIINNIYKEFFG